MKDNKFILLTIDVEDWFQVENFKQWIPFNTWSSREFRVEKNTHRLLDLFDDFVTTQKPKSVAHNPKSQNRNPIKATFFILGWIAERLPHLVREIHARGHEVASHGYNHKLCTETSSDDLIKDLVNSKKLLEDITGSQVHGYRAPSFAINHDILEIIQDCGYGYDSSYNSFNLHGRYGKILLNGKKKRGIAVQISKTQHPASSAFYELPISNLQFERIVIPWGGGAYFRLISFPFFKMGIKTILKKESTYLFYMHPWEIDYSQPKIKNKSLGYKLRHYVNLSKTQLKLEKLIDTFSQCRFTTCRHYLDTNIQ